MKHTKGEFTEPVFIKAGSNKLTLGMFKTAPRVDCRVISEDNYQLLKHAYDSLPKLLDALQQLRDAVFNTEFNVTDEIDFTMNQAKSAIQKATP